MTLRSKYSGCGKLQQKGQSSTIVQIFTLISMRYLPRAKNTYFPIGDSLGGYCPMLYIFKKLSSS